MPRDPPAPPAPVSVIVPAYRARSTIARALRSVAGQTVKPAEVVVVDDGSDDGTFEAAGALRDDLGEIALILLSQANRGAGAARNRAIAASSQPWLAFLDADDEWLADKLARTLEVLEEDDLALVGHNGWIVTDEGATLNDCAGRFREGPDPVVSLYRKGYLDTSTVVVRRDVVEASGGFDPELPNAQDFELWLAVVCEPDARFRVFDDVLSRYHVQPHGIMSHTDRRLRCGLVIARRYAPRLKARPGWALVSLWYRVVALHKEAVEAHWTGGRPGAALRTLVLLPPSIVANTWAALFGGRWERPRYLSADAPSP